MKAFQIPTLHPIFAREVVAHLRSRWMRWAAAAYMAVSFVAIAWQWPPDQVGGYYGGGHEARQVMDAYCLTQLVLTFLAFPVLGAFAISSEKENRTFEALLTTRLTAWSIGPAKLGAVFVAGSVLAACSLSVISFVFCLGGVDLKAIREAVLILGSFAILASVLPLFCSALFRKGYVAWFASLVAIVAMLWVCIAASESISRMFPQPLGGSRTDLEPGIFAALFLLVSVALALATAWLAGRPPAEVPSGRTGSLKPGAPFRTRFDSWRNARNDRSRPPLMFGDTVNPILAKEHLINPRLRSPWRWRQHAWVVVLLMGAFLLILLGDGLHIHISRSNFEADCLVLWIVSLIFTMAWAGLVHATAFAGEQEGRTVEMLKLTALTPGEFLRGKWLACWKSRWPYSLVVAVMFLALLRFLPNRGHFHAGCLVTDAPQNIASALILIELAAVLASWIGLATGNVRSTLIWTFLALLGIILLPSLAFEMFERHDWMDWVHHGQRGLTVYWALFGVVIVVGVPAIVRCGRKLWRASE